MTRMSRLGVFVMIGMVLTGCAEIAVSVATQIAAENIARGVYLGNNMVISRSWKNSDTDFRKLAEHKNSELAKLAALPLPLRVDPENRELKPFTREELIQFREAHFKKNQWETYVDSYTYVTLDMPERGLNTAVQFNRERKAIVVLKGLKNNSLEQTFEAAKQFTKYGQIVIIHPELIKMTKGKKKECKVVYRGWVSGNLKTIRFHLFGPKYQAPEDSIE